MTATVAALVAVGPAYAGQVVFERADDLHVMNDDGTGDRVLATWQQIPGQQEILDPTVVSSGTRVAFSAVRADGDPFACGSNCTAAYLLDDGALRRLSAPSGPTGGNVATFANDPELSPDGALTFFSAATTILSPSSLKAKLSVYDNADGAVGQLATPCDDPRDPAVRPGGSDELAYACDDNKTLWLTGPDPTVGTDDEPLIADDQIPADPAFAPDGDTIVDAEGGADAGLWRIPYDSVTPPIEQILASPVGTTFSSPRFAGSRILFVAARNVWSVPASCSGCAFPASATQLTTSGDVGAIGWTSSTTPIKALATEQPTGTTPTNTTSTNTTTTTTTTTTTATPLAPGITGFSLRGTAKKLRTVLKSGVKVRAGCDRACALSGKAFIDARTAKRYRLGKKKVAVASGRKAGVTGATPVTLKFTAKARKKLGKAKKLKLSIELTATADGQSSKKTAPLNLKR